jgi:hypothetical protein
MRHKTTGVRALVVAAALASACLAACQTARPELAGTNVQSGVDLHGRVTECGRPQCFTFEAVESSLLDFSLIADDGSMAAPQPTLTDPEGREVAVLPYLASPPGAATLKVTGVPIRKTGVHRLTLENNVPGHQVFYRFNHELRFPPIEDMRVRLTAREPSPVYVAAPRGGQVIVRIVPLKGSHLLPEVTGVLDPWGGRALDPSQTPPGMPVPAAGRADDGSLVLHFFAPRPGIYTVLAAARACQEGDAGIYADVRAPAPCAHQVFHTDGSCDFGMPGVVASTARQPTDAVAMR